MSFAEAKESVRKRFEKEKKDSSHDFTHILRVLKYAEMLARKEGADMEVVRYAALFHDYVREAKHEVEGDHATLSAKAAAKILPKYVAKEKIPRILRAIRSHSRSSGVKPKTIEDKIIWDADKLDGFGPMGIARFLIIGDRLGWTIKKGAKNAIDEILEVYNTDFAYTNTAQKMIHARLKKSIRISREILEEAIE
jgi:uncharacterized protein